MLGLSTMFELLYKEEMQMQDVAVRPGKGLI